MAMIPIGSWTAAHPPSMTKADWPQGFIHAIFGG